MVVLDESTAVTVSSRTSLSPLDIRMLSLAYLPLVGSDAVSVYLLLAEDTSFRNGGSARFVRDLTSASGISLENLTSACRQLEGAGLLRTMYRESERGEEVILTVLKPCSPADLLSSELGKIILERVGQPRFESIRAQLTEPVPSSEGFIDCTESGAMVFGLSESGLPPRGGKKRGKGADSTFAKSISEALSQLGYSLKILGEDTDSVFAQAVMYGCTAQVTTRLIADSTGSDGVFRADVFRRLIRDRMSFARPVDDEPVNERQSLGDRRSAALVKSLDTLSTPEYLARVLNVTRAPQELLDLAVKMNTEYGYSSGVVNAVFDYCFKVTRSVPNTLYIDKVAVSLLPKHPKDAYAAALALKEARIEKKTREKAKKQSSEKLRERAKAAVENAGGKQPSKAAARKADEVLSDDVDADDVLALFESGREES